MSPEIGRRALPAALARPNQRAHATAACAARRRVSDDTGVRKDAGCSARKWRDTGERGNLALNIRVLIMTTVIGCASAGGAWGQPSFPVGTWVQTSEGPRQVVANVTDNGNLSVKVQDGPNAFRLLDPYNLQRVYVRFGPRGALQVSNTPWPAPAAPPAAPPAAAAPAAPTAPQRVTPAQQAPREIEATGITYDTTSKDAGYFELAWNKVTGKNQTELGYSSTDNRFVVVEKRSGEVRRMTPEQAFNEADSFKQYGVEPDKVRQLAIRKAEAAGLENPETVFKQRIADREAVGTALAKARVDKLEAIKAAQGVNPTPESLSAQRLADQRVEDLVQQQNLLRQDTRIATRDGKVVAATPGASGPTTAGVTTPPAAAPAPAQAPTGTVTLGRDEVQAVVRDGKTYAVDTKTGKETQQPPAVADTFKPGGTPTTGGATAGGAGKTPPLPFNPASGAERDSTLAEARGLRQTLQEKGATANETSKTFSAEREKEAAKRAQLDADLASATTEQTRAKEAATAASAKRQTTYDEMIRTQQGGVSEPMDGELAQTYQSRIATEREQAPKAYNEAFAASVDANDTLKSANERVAAAEKAKAEYKPSTEFEDAKKSNDTAQKDKNDVKDLLTNAEDRLQGSDDVRNYENGLENDLQRSNYRENTSAGARKAKEDLRDNDKIAPTLGSGPCAHASQISGTSCSTTRTLVKTGELIGMTSQIAGQIGTQISNAREMGNAVKDGASQARQTRAAARMAKTTADAQAGVATINTAMAAALMLRKLDHGSDQDRIAEETKNASFFKQRSTVTADGKEYGAILESRQAGAAEEIAEGPLNRDAYNNEMKRVDLAQGGAAAQEAIGYNDQVHNTFTRDVKKYGAEAVKEHEKMNEAATGGFIQSLTAGLTAAVGAWGSYAAAKELKKAAAELENSGGSTVPDFKSDPFTTDTTDQGRTDISPVPQPSAASAEADVAPEEDVPNLGDGFKTDPNENLPGSPVAGAFKPDDGGRGGAAGGGGGLSASGTSAASADDKQTPQAQYAGLGKGSGMVEREGRAGGGGGRGGGNGEGNGSLADMMGMIKNMFGGKEEEGPKTRDFMALGRQTAASNNDGLLGRGVNIFERVSMNYNARAKTGFGGN